MVDRMVALETVAFNGQEKDDFRKCPRLYDTKVAFLLLAVLLSIHDPAYVPDQTKIAMLRLFYAWGFES
jgi:hypothetical protein